MSSSQSCESSVKFRVVQLDGVRLSYSMGFTRNVFGFACGLASGVYLAQNYAIPNIRQYIDFAVVVALTT